MSTVRATVTLDQELFERAKRAAEALEISRSRLVSAALRDYLERMRSEAILAALNEAHVDEPDPSERDWVRAGSAAFRDLLQSEDPDA